MTTSNVRRLNKRFAEAFGRPDGTQPKYKWVRTTDIQFFLKTGTVEQQTESGLYFIAPVFKRVSCAERLGNTWVIAQWKEAGMTPERWMAVYGTSVPYPANGRYLAIDNTALPPGMEPNEDLTVLAIGTIREQLEKSFADHVAEGEAIANQPIEDAKKQWADIVDDRWPAFDGVPGMKLHTSFPTPQKQIIKPAE